MKKLYFLNEEEIINFKDIIVVTQEFIINLNDDPNDNDLFFLKVI